MRSEFISYSQEALESSTEERVAREVRRARDVGFKDLTGRARGVVELYRH
jgi:hypothetical protein